MRIRKAIGLTIFLVVAHIALSDMFRAFSDAFVATMRTVETASQTATLEMIETR